MQAKLCLVAASLAAACVSAPALAHGPATPGIERRIDIQNERIDRGRASGRLTPREAARLERQQYEIRRYVHYAKVDGVVTAHERRHIDRELDRASVEIARQMHDWQHDYNHDGRPDRPRR
jgi:hypothetical protein